MSYHDPLYGDYDPDEDLCDSCSELFPVEDIKKHEDGNWYCPECFYETKDDRLDDHAEHCREEREGR